jgi:hypothetical protein
LVRPSALRKRSGVDRVEADLVDQPLHRQLGVLVVARDRDSEAVGVARGTAVAEQVLLHDRVECLDHASVGKVGLQQPCRGGPVAVELIDLAISLW